MEKFYGPTALRLTTLRLLRAGAAPGFPHANFKNGLR
jgi:hypothetical protein